MCGSGLGLGNIKLESPSYFSFSSSAPSTEHSPGISSVAQLLQALRSGQGTSKQYRGAVPALLTLPSASKMKTGQEGQNSRKHPKTAKNNKK